MSVPVVRDLTWRRPGGRSESSLRRWANRQGFTLHKSRSRESVDNLGGWMIVNSWNNTIEAGEKFDLTDEDAERFLSEGDQP